MNPFNSAPGSSSERSSTPKPILRLLCSRLSRVRGYVLEWMSSRAVPAWIVVPNRPVPEDLCAACFRTCVSASLLFPLLAVPSSGLVGLEKIIRANVLTTAAHRVHIDEGIAVKSALSTAFGSRIGVPCEILSDQDSKLVGGIQLADLAAHSMGVMLLEHLGYLRKTVKVGEDSGYDPDLDIALGFELWVSLRYAFFKASQPIPGPEGPLGELNFDVANYGLHVASSCDDALRAAVLDRFGECYLGCIH